MPEPAASVRRDPGRTARHCLLVSLPKSGTHLVLRLLALLGYEYIVGDVPQRPPDPPFHYALIARLYERLAGRRPAALGWPPFPVIAGIYEQLGRRFPTAFPSPLSARRYLRAAYGSLGATFDRYFGRPTCFVRHEIDCADARFLVRWSETREPPILFLYRDPRAQLLSFVRYLQPGGRWSARFAPIPSCAAHADVLATLPDERSRLMHAIEDETFPFKDVYSQCTWLLDNPFVCSVSYERLVGVRGGGTVEEQRREVDRVLSHLGIEGDAGEIAEQLYDPGSPTFTVGQADAWREVFTPEHHAAFEARFGRVLDKYGYPTESESGRAVGS